MSLSLSPGSFFGLEARQLQRLSGLQLAAQQGCGKRRGLKKPGLQAHTPSEVLLSQLARLESEDPSKRRSPFFKSLCLFDCAMS